MGEITVLGALWFIITAVVGAVMWAAQIGPKAAASNLADWANWLGIPSPQWLRSPKADRIARHTGPMALGVLVFAGIWIFFSLEVAVYTGCTELIAFSLFALRRRSRILGITLTLVSFIALGIGIWIVISSKSEIAIRDTASASPSQPRNATNSNSSPLMLPKLGTQVAREDFQKAINDMSQIVSRAGDLVKMSGELVGNRPLIRMDNDNGGDLIAKLQKLDTDWKVVYHSLMDGTGGEFFAKFSPTQKQALMSLLPNNSQQIWETYHRELIKFTVAVMMIQDAHLKRLENGAQFERARANADFAADDLRDASSPLHDWVQSVTQRMDQMSNQI